ncbi:endonuclease III [Myxococcota bacterium]|nr:endonuclease III [Myxococcota bacterium]MBU1431800.1 endonuclease III [Myxococcota bacterium]MBU1896662.1 endonuclease III [Myxococcota bacterium]
MTLEEKAARIMEILDARFGDPAPTLRFEDPYTLLVAVMLSAQTTDKKVNEVTPGLFALAKTPQAMARQDEAVIRAAIRTIGLAPTKAKRLIALSQRLVEAFDGVVPQDMAALESLPGVGHKTASVVMSQAFGVPAFPVDTHIHRLARRWGLSDGSNVVKTEADLKAIFPKARWNQLHIQIISFGRVFCPARGHEPSQCPICSWAQTNNPH